MNMFSRPLDGYIIIEASGEIDLQTAPTLRRHLLPLISGEGDRVVLDLTAVSFMDASGLSELVIAERRARLVGAVFRLAGTQRPVAKVLLITGLDRYLAVFPDVEAAMVAGPSGRDG